MSGEARIATVARQRRVLELRTTGMHFADIARIVGYKTESGAYGAFQSALKATLQEPADEVRLLEIRRLDELIASLWTAAIGGNLAAVDRVLAVMARRAAYLGLDAPQKVDIRADVLLLAEQLGIAEAEAVAIAEQVIREARR